jgi:hypothetical protein
MPNFPLDLRAAVAVALVTLAAGCGRGRPALNPVHGKVYYQGKALGSGTIVFTPDASRGGNGALARSEVQADGSYSLRTDQAYGAAPGWYRVTVMAVKAPGKPAPGQRYAVPQSLLPERYRDPELADLVREVKDGRENDIDFHLD